MPDCTICGGPIPEGSRTCSVCGSAADEFFPSGTMLTLDSPAQPATPASVPAGGSYCPVCARVYGPEHADGFCTCGTGLIRAAAAEEMPMAPILDDDVPMAPILDEDVPMAPILDEPTGHVNRDVPRPPHGTPCLVLYGADKQPLQYFPLEKDALLIGRLDAVTGNFPDIDLDEWFDRATIRKISRQHALILRSRATSTFVLRPLNGNTGTQLEAQMLEAMHDFPLRPGHRIILGGVIRLKFEIA